MRVLPLAPERLADFQAVHAEEGQPGWCQCVAWWVETWAGWGERSAGENAALRAELSARGEFDGYLLYEGQRPLAWAQVGPRDRLAKLTAEFELAPDPAAWALSCVQVLPSERGRGRARSLVEGVIADLPRRGARSLEAFPKDPPPGSPPLAPGEEWTGPRALYTSLGFHPDAGPLRRGRRRYRRSLVS